LPTSKNEQAAIKQDFQEKVEEAKPVVNDQPEVDETY